MTPIVYQDFELRIELIPGTDNRYRVEASNLLSGEAKGEFDLPFSSQKLDSLRHTGLPTLEDAKDFGRTLFTSVFANQIYTCLQRSFDAAHGKGQGVRLRLRLTDVPVLADLPWEFLFDPHNNRFLANSTISPLVRYLDLPKGAEALSVSLPLKILVMIANPRGNHSALLDVEEEWQKIRDALDNLEKRGQVELTRLEAANLNVLKHQLRQARYHIFHYVGHGKFDQKSQKGVLLLEDSDGRTFIEDGQHLGVLLHDHPSLRLALLNTCDGARSGHFNPFGGVAQHLVQQGIPAVIAMQSEITDTAAITLAHEFYTALARTCSVDEALAEARQTIYIGGNDIEWATPVLYMRTSNSQLFSLLAEQSDDNSGLTQSVVEVDVPVREAIFRDAETGISEPFPQLWELQRVLAHLYEEDDSIRRVVAKAGLNEQLISFSPSSINTWHSVVKIAAKRYKINAIFQVALAEFEGNPRLEELYDEYLKAANRGEKPDISIELQSERADYKEWSLIQNKKFQKLVQSEITLSSAVDEQGRDVERQKLWDNFDTWLTKWQDQKVFVLLGEKNSGKTWRVASWLDRRISNDTAFPPVLFLPARTITSNDPKELLLNAVKPHDAYVTTEQWQQSVAQWLEEQSSKVPTLLIIIDGIDQGERVHTWWKNLLQNLIKNEDPKDKSLEDPYTKNIAVIVTCSNEYWNQFYQELSIETISYFDLSFCNNQSSRVSTHPKEKYVETREEAIKLRREDFDIREMALLLVGQLIEAYADAQSDLIEVATSWLKNHDQGLGARICEVAMLHVLPRPHITQKIKVVLLLSWLNSPNSWQDIEKTFNASLADNTESYLALFEYILVNEPRNRKARDLLMSAFLYRYPKSSQVRKALEIAIERWLGMVHIAGFPQQRGNESQRTEEVKVRIAQRIGFTLQPGNFTFAGQTLTAIDDDNLLRLGRAALSIISHLPRGPFVHSIATGCVAEAIMDRPDKYELFQWVLSTAPESVWAEVQHEVARLLTFDSPVAQQAASRLLSFEGSKQAHDLGKTLPSDLFPEHFLHLEHKKDPCLSWFTWSKEICKTCLQRTDLEAQYIARRIETHALDPSLTVPDELQQRFTKLAESISIDQIWSTMFTGVQDLAFEQFEPALCAVAPQAIANVIRQIVQTTSGRSELALRQISFRLREHALLFDQEEMQSIYQAWSLLCQSVETWQEEQEMAEMMLFAPVLLNLNAEQQLVHLLQRPTAGSDLLQYENYFLPIQDWVFVEGLLQNITDEHSLLRFLWFISVHAKQIPSGFLFACVMPYVESPSAQVRRLVLQIIHNSQNRYLGLAVVGGWKRDLNNLDEENSLGSLILGKYGSLVTIEDLCQRMDPSHWGYAVQYRGNHPSEVDYFAQKIHTLWQHISNQTIDASQNLPQATIDISTRANRNSAERSMLSISNENQERIQWRASDQTWGGNGDHRHLYPVFPTNEEINEQRARDVAIIQAMKDQEITAGNPWFARRFTAAALEHVVVKHPNLLEQWLQAVSEENSQRLRTLQRCHSFYEALCVVLLQYSPEKGVTLYTQMDRVNLLSRDARTRWQFVDQTLFRTNPVGAIDGLWKKKLQACTTDAQLLTLASMLQWGAGKEWLWIYIEQQLGSDTPLGISRGITLLGYYDSDIAQGRLNELFDEAVPGTWIKQLLEKSIHRWHLNAWSRHWFSRIFSSETNVDAWAAFRLFLRCVDSRFWIWYEQVKDASSVYPDFERRRQHIEINWETTRNRIRKNEDGFEKQLFGQKILQKQAWPWM